MLLRKKKFKNKTIGELNNYTSYRPFSGSAGVFKIFIILACIGMVFFIGKYLILGAHILGGYIGKSTVSIVSSTMGDDMVKDDLGNINIMIVGFGGITHAGGYLADSIMVASFNPKKKALTMISVPRDLYVYDTGMQIIGRINALFARHVRKGNDIASGAIALSNKLEEIVGIKVPYYAIVDFQGFKDIIDRLGGITVENPWTFTDTTYPSNEVGYMTVHFDSGTLLLSGDRALQYARSRHSTSDFSRSLRQQLIIKGIINKLLANGLGNISKLKGLYADYTKMVTTNISLSEILGLARYAYNMDNIFSFGFTTECSNITYKYSYPGCFLYTPPRALYDGASAIIPIGGGGPTAVSFYDYTKNFAFFVAHNQDYLIENQKIAILNGIDKKYAKATIRKSEGFANQLAVKLKKYAFNIIDTENSSQTLTGTTVYVLGTGAYEKTIDTLKFFVDINQVVSEPDPLLVQQYSGTDLLLVLGNNYIDKLALTPFNYYK